ncbi:MAG: type II toxin-antitoxin system RatA family toxin [Pseudomonadota bacterium]|nr:type II toxin-antitoxin system RatA family toxin [Pseudomonadota bacterium]
MRYRESRRLDLPRERIFAVVADIERYPDFVPGWESARVLARDKNGLTVEQGVGIGPVLKTFHSRARIEAPSRIKIESIDGPFRKLEIDWSFVPGESGDCSVNLAVDLQSRGGITGRFIEANFDTVARRLIPLFVDRVRAIQRRGQRDVPRRHPG